MDKAKVFLLALGHWCTDINSGAIPALLPFLVLAYGLSYTETGCIMFGFAVVSSVIQPLFGFLADKWSKSWFIPFGMLLAGFGVAMMGYSALFSWIFLGALLSGVGCAIFHPEAACYVNFLGGTQKALSMSIFSIGGNLGFVTGPLLVGLLIPLTGLHGTAFFGIACVFVAALFLYVFLHMPKDMRKSMQKSRHVEGAENDWKAFGVLTGVVVTRSVFFHGFNAFLALYWMKNYGVSASYGTAILAFFAAVGILSNLSGGLLSDKIGYAHLIRLTNSILLPAILCFSFVNTQALSLLFLLPIAFSLYSPFGAMVLLGQTYLGKNLGLAAGVTLGIARTAGGVVMPLLGLLADSYGLKAAFVTMAFVAVIGLCCAWKLKMTKFR